MDEQIKYAAIVAVRLFCGKKLNISGVAVVPCLEIPWPTFEVFFDDIDGIDYQVSVPLQAEIVRKKATAVK